MRLEIRTNHHWRELKAWYDLPLAAQGDFDYVDGEDRYSPRFLRYRGSWYDTSDMMRTSGILAISDFGALRSWDVYQSDSYFSGIVVRFDRDEWEQVQAGTFLT